MTTYDRRSPGLPVFVALLATALFMLACVWAAVALVSNDDNASTDKPTTMHACTSEDGSTDTLPCYWDATMHGNGIGQSYIIERNGDIRYTETGVSHSARRVSLDSDALRYDVRNLDKMPTCDAGYSVRPCVFPIYVGSDVSTYVMTGQSHVMDVHGRLFVK